VKETTMHYMTATPEDLRAAYREFRTVLYNASRLAQHGRRTARKAAPSAGRASREIELIERVADKRGISLSVKKEV